MNRETTALVQSLISFSIISFLIIIIVFWITYRKAEKIKLDSDNWRWRRLVSILTGCSVLDVVSLSLLAIRQLYFIWCLFQWNNTWVYLIMLIIPGVLYNLLNRRFINLFVDLANSGLLYIALLSKNIFHSYIVNVAAPWHVILFLVLLMICSLLYSLFFYFKNVENITERNIRYLRKKNKK